MLDARFVIANLELVRENAARRGFPVDFDALTRAYEARRQALTDAEDARRQLNELTRQLHGKPSAEQREVVGRLQEREASCTDAAQAAEVTLAEQMSLLPNILDARVPLGGENENVVVRTVGEVPEFSFPPKSHDELGAALHLIDIPRGVKAAKPRFYLLKNEAVMMRGALTRLFYDLVKEQGWELVSPPYAAKERTLYASGYLPFAAKENFELDGWDLTLIGTSEQVLLGMHLDDTLRSLPLLYLGDSMCFRTEVGGAGRDTSGIFRVHQFYKLEQFVYCHPDDAELWHQRCLENEERLMQVLGVPYRVVLTASQDIAAPGRIKYDTEAWMPAQGKYREMTSNTNLGDYQTRRGNIRFRTGAGKGFPYTISATALCDRLILSILENFQREDGTVVIPERLRPYLDNLAELRPKDR